MTTLHPGPHPNPLREVGTFHTFLLLSVIGLSACGGGGGGGSGGQGTPEPPALTQPLGLSAAPSVSTRGSLTLEQYDRDARPSAAVSRSSRFTLIPEGASL